MVHQNPAPAVASRGPSRHIQGMQWFFLLFPFLELWTLIELGAATSPLLALGWVFLGVFLGMAMIRRQGLSMLRQAQQDSESGLITPRFLGDDLAVVTSGLLLMVPGLVTDIMALVVLIGPLRRVLLKVTPVRTRSSMHVHMTARGRRRPDSQGPAQGPSQGPSSQENITIEGDYNRLDD